MQTYISVHAIYVNLLRGIAAKRKLGGGGGSRELTPPLFPPCYATPLKINISCFDNYVQCIMYIAVIIDPPARVHGGNLAYTIYSGELYYCRHHS